MRKLSVALVLVLLVCAFVWLRAKPAKDKEVSHNTATIETAPYLGELGPYFTGKEFHYVGTFYKRNFCYILENEGGTLSNTLSQNHKVADVWIAREAMSIIVQQPKTKKFILFDPSNPETKGLSFEQLTFQDVPQESDIAKGWARANSPESFSKDRKKGKNMNWIFVESAPTPTDIRQVYVGDEIKTNEKYNCRTVPLLEVIQERYMFFLDPDNNRFGAVRTDVLGTPEEEIKYRDITPGSAGEAVLKAISTKPAKP